MIKARQGATMSSFYEVQPAHYKIQIHDGHKWSLPAVRCPTCGFIWSGTALSLPCVDLSRHPDAEKLATPRVEEDVNEFIRLREAIRPLVPKGLNLEPGTALGPAVGPATGTGFGALTMGFPWMLLARPEGVAFLKAEGLRGIEAGPTDFEFQGTPEPVMELQIEPFGKVHPDCLPPVRRSPCPTCGRTGISLPQPLLVDPASLPEDRDIFRLADYDQVIAVTARFVEAASRLGSHDLAFVELSGPALH